MSSAGCPRPPPLRGNTVANWSAVNRPVSGPMDPHNRIRCGRSCFSLSVPSDCCAQPGMSVATATPNTFNATWLVQACGQLRCRLLTCLASRPSDAHTHAHQSTLVRVTHGHSGPQPLASWSVVPVSPAAPCSPPLACRSVARGCTPPAAFARDSFRTRGQCRTSFARPSKGENKSVVGMCDGSHVGGQSANGWSNP